MSSWPNSCYISESQCQSSAAFRTPGGLVSALLHLLNNEWVTRTLRLSLLCGCEGGGVAQALWRGCDAHAGVLILCRSSRSAGNARRGMRGRSDGRTARTAKKSRRQLNPRTIFIVCKKVTDSTESSSSLAAKRALGSYRTLRVSYCSRPGLGIGKLRCFWRN